MQSSPLSRARLVAIVLAVAAVVGAIRIATLAMDFNNELVLPTPAAVRTPPTLIDPKTPRLSQRVILVIVDGLRLDHSHLPAFDALRAKGIAGIALAPYPTVSRPNYISLLTGVPPVASGIRVNRVPMPIRVDSIMKRAVTAKLRVVTASDIGMVPPLFVNEDTGGTSSSDHVFTGDLVTPGPGFSWPFDEVRKADNGTANLEVSLARVLEKPSDLVIVLSGDVDRAGHAYGVTQQYRDAAAAMDGALARLIAQLDLTKDTLIVTADHGHVNRGGHGGVEPEAGIVPLIIAGAGIVPGAITPNATLLDVAPTIAALLGIPAPGHAHGRTLVELLRFERADVEKRIAADEKRLVAARGIVEHGPPATGDPDRSGPNVMHLAIVGSALLLAILIAILLRSVIAIPKSAWVGVLAWLYLLLVMAAACRGRLSPSEVPALWRLQRLLAVCGAGAIAIQLVASWHVVRSRPPLPRLAKANGIALVGLAVALVSTFTVRGVFAKPHVEVPEPEWLVAIPALELASAVACAAIALQLGFELIRSLRATHDHGVAR
jgi:hypothetical protein